MLSTKEAVYHRPRLNRLEKSFNSPTIVHQLRLFLDSDGLLCCAGRIHNASVASDTRFPVLLPHRHHLTELLVRYCHARVIHSEVQSTVVFIRPNVWSPHIRQYVKTILRKYVTCRKVMRKPYPKPCPPPLPEDRLRDALPFTITGLDFSGTSYVEDQRNSEVYICVFTCATTSALHLEIVSNMSAETFMLAFRST